MPNSIEKSVINAIRQEGQQCRLRGEGETQLLSVKAREDIIARIAEDGCSNENLLRAIENDLEQMVTVVSTGDGVFFRPSGSSADVLREIIAKHNLQEGQLFLD